MVSDIKRWKINLESYKKMWDAVKPLIAFNKIGKPVLFGTGGRLDDKNGDLEKMFYNPKEYGFIPYPPRVLRWMWSAKAPTLNK